MPILSLLLSLALPLPYPAVLPAVVYIRAEPDGVGTGFVVDAGKKWVLTCRHVVADRKTADVFFPRTRNGKPDADRNEYLANRTSLTSAGLLVVGRVIRTDDALDLALLELPSLPIGTPALTPSTTPPAHGEAVFTIGNRADLDTLWNYSAGAVRQSGLLADGYDWQGKKLATGAAAVLLQIPVGEGDSGGPVLNARGEVVAVVAARRPAPLAGVGISAAAVRRFLGRSDSPREPVAESLADRITAATVWVRPTATDARTAGVVIDAKRRWVLTSAAGVGTNDRVGVVFPLRQDGRIVGERDAYRDPVALHLAGAWRTGEVIHRDLRRDLALIQLDSTPSTARALTLATTDGEVGDTVYAVSHPTGTEFAFAYSTGVVKQRIQTVLTRDTAKAAATVLQLPAQATSAGGPITNAGGELIGVLASKDAPNLTGYAASLNEVRAFLAEADGAVLRTAVANLWDEMNTAAKFVGWARLAAGDRDGSLAVHPACVPALLRRAAQNPTATDDLDRIIEHHPQHRDALLRRAEVWLNKSEAKKALADLQRILEVTPADADARQRLAVAHAASGDEAKAAAEFANVLRLDAKRLAAVLKDVSSHADVLERKADTRAADWLALALRSIHAVLPKMIPAAALKQAVEQPDGKPRLTALRVVIDQSK